VTRFLSQTLYHEARHAYQASLAAIPGNDADGDFLVKNAPPIAPTTAIVDSTNPRLVCNEFDGPNGTTLILAYQGDSIFDTWMGPNWAWYAAEMDAWIFAGSH
jgi:hypothetical protein